MEEKDKKGFLILMAMLAEAFKEDVSTERAKIYFEFLNQFTFFQVTLAIKECIKTLKFFPKISEIREFIMPQGAWGENFKEMSKEEAKQTIEWVNNISKILGGRKRIPLIEDKQRDRKPETGENE